MNEQVSHLKPIEADLDTIEAVTEAIGSLHMVRESRPPIKVTLEKGIVTLEGVVLSHIMHRAVLVKTATARGVQKVVDRLYEDPLLEVAVANALAVEPMLKQHQPSISVTSYLGVVTLSGATLGEAERAKAKEVAAHVPGVSDVILRLGT